MRFFERLVAILKGRDPRSVYRDTAQITGIFAPPLAPPPDSGPLAESELENPTIGRAVNVISADCASVPLVLSRRAPNARKRTLIDSHPAIDVFRWINRVDTPNIYWQSVYADLLTYGDSFTWIDDTSGLPENLLRLPAGDVTPIPHPRLIISGYEWQDSMGKKETYSAEQILHFKTRNPSSIYRGLSPLEPLRRTILTEIQMRDWNYNRFRNNIASTLILTTPKRIATDEEMEQLKAELRQKQGAMHAGEPLIVSGEEWKVAHIPRPSEEELGFLGGLKFNRAEIATRFGVPPSELMDFSDAFRANAREQARAYWEATIMSWHRLVLEYLNSVYLRRYWPEQRDLEFIYDYSQVKALGPSAFEQAQVNEILVRSGIRTPNEARHAMGDDAVDDEAADQLYINGRSLGENPEDESEPDEPLGAALSLVPQCKLPTGGDLLDPEDEVARLRKRLERILAEIVRVSGEQQLSIDGLAGVFNVADPGVIQFIENQSILVSSAVVNTTVEMIRKALAEGLEAGLPFHGLREQLQAAFRERRKGWQLDRIARTEIHQAQEGGAYHAAAQAGVEFKRWVSSRDSKVRGPQTGESRADHTALEGVVVPIGARFSDPVSGAQLMYPGDVQGGSGPDVVNCRCTWVSEIPEEEKLAHDADDAWVKKTTSRRVFEQAFRKLLRGHITDMESRALAEFERLNEAVA